MSQNKDCVFGEFWAKQIKESKDINKTVVDMINGPCSGILGNALYKIFTADKVEDIRDDLLNMFANRGEITAGLQELFQKNGKKLKNSVETVAKRIRNATQHGLYVDSFDGCIYLYGSKEQSYNIETPIEYMGKLSTDNILEMVTLKEINPKLLTEQVKQGPITETEQIPTAKA